MSHLQKKCANLLCFDLEYTDGVAIFFKAMRQRLRPHSNCRMTRTVPSTSETGTYPIAFASEAT